MSAGAVLTVPRSDRHRPISWRRALLALGVAAVILVQPAAAQAAGPVFAVEPLGAQAKRTGYFVLDGAHAATLSGRVRVANTGTQAGDVRLYPVDATTGQTSGAVYRTRTDPRRDVGAWTSVKPARVHLTAGASRNIAFTVRLPAGVRAGDHLGGLVAENARLGVGRQARRGAGRFQIRVRNLTVIAIEVRSPGARRAGLTPTSLRAGGAGGRQTLLLGLRNTGNVLTKGSGELTVTKDGARVRQARFPLDTFVPQTAIAFPVPVRGKALAAGDYRGTAILHVAGRTIRRSFAFRISSTQLDQVFRSRPDLRPDGGRSVVPLIAGGAALLAAGFGLSALLFRRRTPASTRDETGR